MLAFGSLAPSSTSSAPLHCFLLCEPTAMGLALMAAGLNDTAAAAVSVVYAAHRVDFASALLIRDARRQVDPAAFERAQRELLGWEERVTLDLWPRPEAIDVLEAWEKKNEELGRDSRRFIKINIITDRFHCHVLNWLQRVPLNK